MINERVKIELINQPITETPSTTIAGAGAVVVFHGIVRPEESGRQLHGLSYTTYDPMAENELRRIAEEATDRFGLLHVQITHSRGFVAIHETSLLLIVASAHRKQALQALDEILDTLKRNVPIWKTPIWADDAEVIG